MSAVIQYKYYPMQTNWLKLGFWPHVQPGKLTGLGSGHIGLDFSRG
ncbi:MAG: hypothetical protein OEM28_01850 [Nitrosopumilus sp.]|nr:hypothetical protein [Nitrosopumilus sp.]MDH3487821.1 hypothetical protein [Nitrosopumilus sp.]